MKLFFTSLAVAVPLFFSGVLNAATYAVDPANGNDSNPGTAKQPWKTMAPVNQLELKGGDKLLLRPGTVVGSLAPHAAGTKENPVQIIFAAGTYNWQAEGLNEEKLHISNTNDAPDMPKRIMIDLHDAKHTVLSGKGALLLCRGRMMEIHMDACEDITFKDFAVDYARPTVSEYTALETGEKEAVFSIHKDSKYRIDENGKLFWVGDGWEEEATLSPDGHRMELTLADDMPEDVCPEDWCLENVTATPAVTVKKSLIKLIPTRAFLLTTRRPIVIEDCTFIGTHNAAILVADDARSWYESGMVRDMTVKGNTFTECGEPVIKFHPENKTCDAPVHTGIRILNNTFNLLGRGAVGMKSTGDVLIKGNTIRAAHEGDTVLQDYCTNVRVVK